MDYSQRLAISYYKTIATLNESHKIYLVQHQETKKIYVKKILDVYNKDIYLYLSQNHINGIPSILDIYEEDNQLVVVESYISGCSLQEKIDASNIRIDSIYRYMIELCDILGKMHSLQPPIIHRDIKPSNIIITEYDHVMLLDFNAAKYFKEPTNADTVLLGTKGYAAPEQYGFGSSTPRTDIYALGILLRELTSVLPSVPKSLNDIITKCIQINPADRYQSAGELKNALEKSKNPSVQTGRPRETKSKTVLTTRSFFPPGFRTLTPWKMFVSTLVYLFVFWLCLTMGVENTYGLALWVERIFCLLMMLSVVFISCNYLDIQRWFPLCKHRFKIVRFFGVILFDIMIFAALFFILLFIEVLFFM